MSNVDPIVIWFESEEYLPEVTFEQNPDDGVVASFAYWRVRVDNSKCFTASEQVGILTAAMMFGPEEGIDE